MLIFPAIDLYEGKAVRLYRGDYNQMTVYNPSPLEVVKDFLAEGASCLHLVDLEGAKSGKTPNLEVIRSIAGFAKKNGMFTELGGGIRSMETVRSYLDAGIDRVILGTAAVTDEAFLREALDVCKEKVAVGIDIKDSKVAIHGWTQTVELSATEFCERMQRFGLQTVICTDISRDGAMKGANLAVYGELAKVFSGNIIASGGVSSLEDVKALAEAGLYGAIIGKAYYIGAISLSKAIEVAG